MYEVSSSNYETAMHTDKYSQQNLNLQYYFQQNNGRSERGKAPRF